MDIPFNKGLKSIRAGQNYYLSRRLVATSGQRQSRKKQTMMGTTGMIQSKKL
ncbi:MAG: hypothetical protein KBG43_04200 [Paludibacteraceae bacterium]|nr:hypothetical protein [Paludibacteraceae bacterium]